MRRYQKIGEVAGVYAQNSLLAQLPSPTNLADRTVLRDGALWDSAEPSNAQNLQSATTTRGSTGLVVTGVPVMAGSCHDRPNKEHEGWGG